VFLLCPPILAEDRDQLLGACVVDPTNPTEKLSPSGNDEEGLPKKSALQILPDMDPNPVEIKNYRDIKRRGATSRAKLAVEEIFTLFFKDSTEQSIAREAAHARWWKMQRPHDRFRELLKDEQYKDGVIELLKRVKKKGDPVWFVANVLVLSTMKSNTRTGHAIRGDFSVAAPDPNTFGLTEMAHIGVGAEQTREDHVGVVFPKEMIIGLGVYKVYLSKPKKQGRWSPFKRRHNPDEIIQTIELSPKELRDLRMGFSLEMPLPDDRVRLMSQNGEKPSEEETSIDPDSDVVDDFDLYYIAEEA